MERNYSKLKNIDEKFHKVALTISLPKPVDNFVDDLDEYFENPESHFSKNDLMSDYLMIDDDRDTQIVVEEELCPKVYYQTY